MCTQTRRSGLCRDRRQKSGSEWCQTPLWLRLTRRARRAHLARLPGSCAPLLAPCPSCLKAGGLFPVRVFCLALTLVWALCTASLVQADDLAQGQTRTLVPVQNRAQETQAAVQGAGEDRDAAATASQDSRNSQASQGGETGKASKTAQTSQAGKASEAGQSGHGRPLLTVRCPFFESSASMHRTSQGEYVGYNIDYMREVAQLANLDLHFVPADSELDAQRLFAEGRVDIYPGLCPSPERRATYLFSRLSTGCMTGTILVRENDTRFAHEDWATLGRVRVGVEAFNPHIKLFRDKCTSQDINPECVQYNGVQALIHALEAGEVDAIVVNDFWSPARTRCIARFAPHPVYVATLASRPDIMARINEALEQIAIHQPGFASSLYIRYFQSGSEERPLVTRDELAFLATKPRLRVAYESGRQPIIAADPETGQIQGIVADIYRQIEAFSGLAFEFVCLQETEALREMAKGRVTCSPLCSRIPTAWSRQISWPPSPSW